ncbi:MAG: hypothetical protein LBS06_03255 [Treponema sp.]|jgi:site-specific DNA-methyltransferase (cytosine-N4-specific)|nr:hypothetical protein [Treponema sp.]
MNKMRLKMKSYIQPFERILAIRELQTLCNKNLMDENDFDNNNVTIIESNINAQELINRLSYWETVEHGSNITATKQSLRESTVSFLKNGITFEDIQKKLPFKHDIPFPSRRCLRYGPHGIHEYRGKFFPQLVRSLINISGTKPGELVGDPMCGSGTTAVEALLSGYNTVGMDMNPLSVYIGKVKCQLLGSDPEKIALSYERISKCLERITGRRRNRLDYFESLQKTDQDYLKRWFSEKVLGELDEIIGLINSVDYKAAKDLMRISFSNILRAVSWQKKDDLRVRKEIRSDIEINPKIEFLKELDRSVKAVIVFLYQNGKTRNNFFKIIEYDAKQCVSAWGEKTVDVIISSPPYATALPYLDTDRLSLSYLNFLPRNQQHLRNQNMIGNREVSEALRCRYWEQYTNRKAEFPSSVQNLIENIEILNSSVRVGFRRRNLPALLAKYFFDMKEVINSMYQTLKPGRFAYLVVGNNHTTAGDQRIDIMTSNLLEDIAMAEGFKIEKSISMEVLVSRDIFRNNAMSSESILVFRRPL